ncbi:hypothetical protein L6164_018301 [Bauhinia variegata]|uniref:Uncharacterized protein n=1 Tax=Bauhinia variegata TaxID=167791 RepID=A0ACB9NAK7_BAUVA|nr:hypothetical protein L6164_018301 [Bauhinia variegata]
MNLLRCLLLFLHILWLASLAFGALSEDEVEALKDIANTLGKHDWDFNVDPCNLQGTGNWSTPGTANGDENAVTCGNCSQPINATNQICHVVRIVLKGQNLQGTLPPELVRLPYLQEFSLIANRITGPIPAEIANISTLRSFVVEFNQLSGMLPPALGNLMQLQRLFLTSNNFTGEIPATFAKLTALQDFRIVDNQFSGSIPDFIQNWTSLTKLVIQGSSLSGPIPSGVSFLTQMKDLRISDLSGPASTFPQVINLTNLKTLILRSCNIYGTLPEYLGAMTNIKVLDLSFNNLSGPIPNSYAGLRKADYIYLTGNFLSGAVPDWTHNSGPVDLSYNNFSIGNQEQRCQAEGPNLFASSSPINNSETVACLRSNGCPRNSYHSFHINCGGKSVTVNPSTYDADTDSGGPAKFLQGGTNWAYSNTGHFLDTDQSVSFTPSNNSRLSVDNAELYMNARASPNSLTYYGFCLANGNYTVDLHFAEIMFSDDRTYNSLGRRIFDVYIQRNLVLKDFNIAKEAGGVRKAIIKNFTAVVTNSTLEIHFRWMGKGTIAVPFKSVYGPLISAISVVDPDYIPPLESGNSISAGAVVGIVAAGAILIILVFVILWWRGCLGQKSSLAKELKGLDLKTGLFTLRQIKAATDNFNVANKIGEGGFGPVYKGSLSDGTIVAVKQLSAKSRQGNREFINEIGVISALQHPCLVKLYGCCVEGDQLLLVYEYMENNSLARALFGPQKYQLQLDWPTSGRTNTSLGSKEDSFYLLDWAHLLKEKGNLMELVDRRLGSDFSKEEVMVVINVALLCTNVSSTLRPAMSSVVSMMEGKIVVPQLVLEPSEVLDEKKLEAMRKYYQQVEEDDEISEVKNQSVSLNAPWTDSSTSATDLYPVQLDSSYWEKRN